MKRTNWILSERHAKLSKYYHMYWSKKKGIYDC